MSKNHKITLFIFVLAALMVVWKINVIYLPMRLFGYIVPPGGDPINHMTLVYDVMKGNFSSQYPPLFHLLIGFFSKISGAQPLDTIRVLTPLLILLPPIAIYVFLSKNFSRLAGIIGFALTILSSNYGLIAYGDGNYPNILAAGFFMPLSLTFFCLAFKEKARRNIMLGLLFAVLLILTHHLSTALYMAVFVIFLLVLAIWNRYESITPRISKILLALFGCLIVAGIAIYFSPVKTNFVQAYQAVKSSGSAVASSEFLDTLTLNQTAQMTGELVFYLGLGGLIYLCTMLTRDKKQTNKPAIILLVVWFALIYGLSQTEFAGLPARIGREVAIPLISAGGS